MKSSSSFSSCEESTTSNIIIALSNFARHTPRRASTWLRGTKPHSFMSTKSLYFSFFSVTKVALAQPNIEFCENASDARNSWTKNMSTTKMKKSSLKYPAKRRSEMMISQSSRARKTSQRTLGMHTVVQNSRQQAFKDVKAGLTEIKKNLKVNQSMMSNRHKQLQKQKRFLSDTKALLSQLQQDKSYITTKNDYMLDRYKDILETAKVHRIVVAIRASRHGLSWAKIPWRIKLVTTAIKLIQSIRFQNDENFVHVAALGKNLAGMYIMVLHFFCYHVTYQTTNYLFLLIQKSLSKR